MAVTLPVRLTFEALVEGCDVCDAWPFTRPACQLSGGGIARLTGYSSVRLLLGLGAGRLLGVAFAGAFCVGSLPFELPFPFSGGCSPSLEVVVVLSLELDDFDDFYKLSANAFMS